MVAAAVTVLFFLLAIFAPLLAGAESVRSGAAATDEFADLAAVDRRRPEPVPARHRRTGPRRVFRHSLRPAHFARRSACSACVFSGTLGIVLGLIAGYVGGAVDGLIMRIADVQLTFPAILIALLVNGVAKSVFGNRLDAMSTLAVLVFAIGLSFWVQYARTVRGSVMVEKNKDYVAAAQLIGLPAPVIMLRHVLPNTMGPILVIATINLALAIITEATLSFLGAGMPDTMPSLGTLIRIGNNYLFAGEWWIVAFPGIALAALILSINLLGDWLRDALNPKLR